jgi:hypothetical protein
MSFNWSKLIMRIYEVEPLLCRCGKEIKIVRIVTDSTQIWSILNKIGWPTTIPDFDEPQDLVEWDICQLLLRTADGFLEANNFPHTTGPDPPEFENNIDIPHWEESFI